MKLPEFVETGNPRWEELEALVRRAGSRPSRLSPVEIRRLATLYRTVTADLALARRRFPRDPVIERLERLTLRSRALVYQGTGRREAVTSFFTSTYWRLIYERRRPLGLALVLLVVPAVLAVVWSVIDSESLIAQLPPEFLWVTQAESTDQGYGTAGLIGFSTYVLTNNIRVTLLSFALGVAWGLGTGWVVFTNGIIFGGLVGLALDAGNWRLLLAAVMAHGVLEFSCILVGGAAGLSLGRAILRPGRLTRREALGREAVVAVQMALGTALWLVVAGFLEGFASRTGLGWVPTTIIGIVVGAVFWGLVVWRGRKAEVDVA